MTTAIDNPVNANIETLVPPKKKVTRASKHDFHDGRGRVRAHRHDNGGGWVEDTASVADSVFVAKTASVYHKAELSGSLRVAGHARVCGSVIMHDATGSISDYAYVAGLTEGTGCALSICGFARLYGGTLVGAVRVQNNARVQGTPTLKESNLYGNSFVGGTAYIEQTNVFDSAVIGGWARVLNSEIRGDVEVGNEAVVFESIIRYDNPQPKNPRSRLKIYGDSQIILMTRLSGLLHINGAVFAGGSVMFAPYFNANAAEYEAIVCEKSVCIAGSTISTHGEMELATRGRAAGQNTLTYNPAHATAAFDMNNLVPRRRLTAADS